MIPLERRRATRIVGGYKVDLVSEGVKYAGEVENLSEDGACIMMFAAEVPVDFQPDDVYEMHFYSLLEETLICQCRVKWARKASAHGLTSQVGMQIIDPPWDKSKMFI